MKLLLTKAFFALSIYGAQAQIPVCSTPSSDKPGNVQVYADPILKQHVKPTEVPPGEEVKLPGFRVQIYSGNDRDKATQIRNTVMQQYPNQVAYLTYEAPYFKIRVGDFRNRLESQKMLSELKSQYTGVLLVPDKINFPPITR
ncbi:MAG: SPOR domain-containing protein [Sphingobacteriales bacterium]|nr:MAG: SPOR domain-containing protein [Sphingobacteriales bacterium]